MDLLITKMRVLSSWILLLLLVLIIPMNDLADSSTEREDTHNAMDKVIGMALKKQDIT